MLFDANERLAKENARSTVGAVERARDTSNLTAEVLHPNFIPQREKSQVGYIENLLPHGAENAVSAATLMILGGYTDSRSMRAAIEAERRAGALILCTRRVNGGYFLPDDGEKGRA